MKGSHFLLLELLIVSWLDAVQLSETTSISADIHQHTKSPIKVRELRLTKAIMIYYLKFINK